MLWFTSDTHFGHKNIIDYCNRPFKDVPHMDSELVRRWNELVSPEDTVIHLGDVAMGLIDESLAKIGLLNGYKILVEGNHDRGFMKMGKSTEEEWRERYREVFDEVYDYEGFGQVEVEGIFVGLSHFPYAGDSEDADRYDKNRPKDKGRVLLHGHTHSTEKISRSSKGTLQVHVGVDAWDYRPVPSVEIARLIREHS